MNNVQPVLAALQDALLRRMGDEVELVLQYGSHVRGATHRYSDVDLSWVPVHETTWESITVLVGDRLADLYPMHWSKLERMAELRDVSASVLLRSRILYQRDEDAAARFHGLTALGFPAMTPHLATGDFAALHQQCLAFDQYLRDFLIERSVELNDFATLDDLQAFLGIR